MICVDSDCIIDFLKGKEAAVKAIGLYKDEIVTTELSAFEVYFGIYQRKSVSADEERAAGDFFSSVEVLPFDTDCGKTASKILASLFKEGNAINQNDVLIVSIMLKHEVGAIITRNEKHFSKVRSIRVVSY